MRARRKALKLSQEEAGYRTWMNQSQWSRIERGVVDPGMRMITRIATALETTPAALLAGIDASNYEESNVTPPVAGNPTPWPAPASTGSVPGHAAPSPGQDRAVARVL